jgi:prepilin-type N-terminal cleavage/methylation domain-containing protein
MSRPVERGFTLIEIAIVLVIIGVMLTGILNAQSIIRNARIKDTTRAVMDLSAGARQFRDRYGAWPGDLNNASTAIPGLAATCNITTGNNGRVDTAAESTCASEMLIRSAMLRGDVSRPITIGGNVTLSITSPTLSLVTGLPSNWVNVIRIQNIDCDIAIQLDKAMDDGNVTSGYFRTNTVCAGEDENIPVPNAVLQLS